MGDFRNEKGLTNGKLATSTDATIKLEAGWVRDFRNRRKRRTTLGVKRDFAKGGRRYIKNEGDREDPQLSRTR